MTTRAASVAAAACVAVTTLLAAAGCAPRPVASRVPADSAAAAAGATGVAPATIVTVHQEGGFAGLAVDATVDGVSRRYQTVTRHLCGAEGANCPPPIDSASGPLSDSLAAAVGRAVDGAGFFALRGDYGTDPRLRDGFAYAVTVRRGARSATVRADDGTRPPALATLVAEVTRVIARARGK